MGKNDKGEGREIVESTVVTSVEGLKVPRDERAYILFISGALIGKMYLLDTNETVIGRAPDVDIEVADTRISRHHVKIVLSGGKTVIEDMGSTNGTFVNGERIARQALKSGDKVHLSSDTLFKFAVGDAAERMFQKEMHEMANYDAVTGIFNKHVFARRLKEEFSFARRNKASLSLLMIDIDFFKKVNDAHGHMAGDYILCGVAERIRRAVRDEDILARYGGEEFGVILRGTDKQGTIQLAERIRILVAERPFVFEGKDIPITISLGAATLAGDDFPSPKELIAMADANLYKSKESGRNKVTG